jgi:putative photosynthetic complex assembly protein
MSTAVPSLRAARRREPHPDTFPKWVLMSGAGIIALSLISVGLVRLTGNGPDQRPAPSVQERQLRFEDRPDGSIAITDGRTGEQVSSVQGEQGFVRGALRSLARERRRSGLGPEQPFELMGHTNGRITLRDPATGMRLNLESFGPTNAANFSRLQSASPATPAIFESPSTQGKS